MPSHHLPRRRTQFAACLPTLIFAGIWAASVACGAPPLHKIGELKFTGQWDESTAISAIAFSGDHKLLFLAADESGDVYVFRSTSDPLTYAWSGTTDVRVGTGHADDEADVEGLAVSGPWLYVIGSHSKKRERIKPESETRAANRKRHLDIDDEKGRRVLVRLRWQNALDPDVELQRVKLWPRLEENPLLKPFTRVPSKENGLDIEGLAVDGDRLLIGFRSPVLRDGYAVSMETTFDDVAEGNLRFLGLEGRGIRDLARLDVGRFLVLFGPSGESGADYGLALWDGKDTTEGNDGPAEGRLKVLGAVPVESAAKAEGVAVLRQTPASVDLVVVYDGLPGGKPTVFRCPLPNPESN